MTADPAQQLGDALREAREQRRFGVRELARRIGVSPGRIALWEQGKRVPSPIQVALILGALGIVGTEQKRILELALFHRLYRTGERA